jgi:hypothetical protein
MTLDGVAVSAWRAVLRLGVPLLGYGERGILRVGAGICGLQEERRCDVGVPAATRYWTSSPTKVSPMTSST